MIIKDAKYENLNNFLKTKYTVLFAFANYCGTCHLMKPEVEKLGMERNDVNVVMLKIDDNQKFVAEKQIPGTPVTFIFKDGKEIKRIDGFKPKKFIEGELK